MKRETHENTQKHVLLVSPKTGNKFYTKYKYL